jgi:hypothetical protein
MNPSAIETGSPDRPIQYEGFKGLSWVSNSELKFLIRLLPDRGLFLEIGTASGPNPAAWITGAGTSGRTWSSGLAPLNRLWGSAPT